MASPTLLTSPSPGLLLGSFGSQKPPSTSEMVVVVVPQTPTLKPNPKNLTLQPSTSNSNGSNSITVTRVILEMVVVVVVKTLTLKPSPKNLNLTT